VLTLISLRPQYAQTTSIAEHEFPVTLGRDGATADIVPSWHPKLSRTHCRFTCVDGEWFVADLGSTNGTELNDESVGEVPVKLNDGDVLRLGSPSLEFTVRIEMEVSG
jgi:pSer/pThr/pTyr-binding forkhead associated (FHA) protein